MITEQHDGKSMILLRSAELPRFLNSKILMRHWGDGSYDCHVAVCFPPNTSLLLCTYPHTTPQGALAEARQIVLYERWLRETEGNEEFRIGDIQWVEA